MPRLLTTDLKAIAYVLQCTDIYHKPELQKRFIGQVFGFGIGATEDEQHRIQRKSLNPAFGIGKLRDLTGIFLDKANEVSVFIL
jgi:cytochrome P450